MRYCGVDISAKPANQQLVTLHERRAPEGGIELVATFYAPGTVEQVARTIEGFGRGGAVVAVDAPSGPRLDLLGAGRAAARRARAARRAATSACGSATRCCSAAACRCTRCRPAAQSPQGWEEWIGVGFELFAALADSGCYRPDARGAAAIAPVGSRRRCASGGCARPTRTRSSAALLGHRPSPKRTPWGLQQRIAALQA